MRGSNARPASSISMPRRIASSALTFHGCQRSRSGNSRASSAASGSPLAGSFSVYRAIAQACSMVCSIDVRIEIGRVRRALAPAEIDRDRNAAVARALDRFDFAEAHVDAETVVDARGDVGLAGALGAAAADHVLGDLLKTAEVGQAGIFVDDDVVHCADAKRCDVPMSRRDPPQPLPDELPPSRSQQRRDALEIFDLAETLAGLSDAQLARVPLVRRASRRSVAHARGHFAHRAQARDAVSRQAAAQARRCGPRTDPPRARARSRRSASRRRRAAPCRNLAHAPDRRRRRGARRAARGASFGRPAADAPADAQRDGRTRSWQAVACVSRVVSRVARVVRTADSLRRPAKAGTRLRSRGIKALVPAFAGRRCGSITPPFRRPSSCRSSTSAARRRPARSARPCRKRRRLRRA